MSTETRTWSFPTREPVTLELTWHVGEVEIATSHDGVARVRIDHDDEAQATVEMRPGGTLAVVGPRDAGRRTTLFGLVKFSVPADCSLELPAGSSIRYDIGSADLTMSADVETITGRSGSGDVEIERCVRITATSGSGDLEVGEIDVDGRFGGGSGDLRIKVCRGRLGINRGSGDVEIGEVFGPLTFVSGSGEITVDTSHGSVQASTGSGDIYLETCEPPLNLSTGSGDITLPYLGGTGEVRFQTSSGEVDIHVLPGPKVWTDVGSRSGDIDILLEPRGLAAEGEPFLSIVGSTGSGDIIVGDA